MERAVIKEKVFETLEKKLGVTRSKIQEEMLFEGDLGADSLDIVEVVMDFEDTFDIEIPDEAWESIKSVKDAIDYLEKHVK
jgi:acyl carrier protein